MQYEEETNVKIKNQEIHLLDEDYHTSLSQHYKCQEGQQIFFSEESLCNSSLR